MRGPLPDDIDQLVHRVVRELAGMSIERILDAVCVQMSLEDWDLYWDRIEARIKQLT